MTGFHEIPFLDGVHRDQIDMTVKASDQTRQCPGLLEIIVHSPHQAVLKSQPPASSFIIIAAGLQNLLQGIAVGNWHQGFPHLVVRRVKGQGQSNLKPFFCKPANLRNQTASGNREISLADI